MRESEEMAGVARELCLTIPQPFLLGAGEVIQ